MNYWQGQPTEADKNRSLIKVYAKIIAVVAILQLAFVAYLYLNTPESPPEFVFNNAMSEDQIKANAKAVFLEMQETFPEANQFLTGRFYVLRFNYEDIVAPYASMKNQPLLSRAATFKNRTERVYQTTRDVQVLLMAMMGTLILAALLLHTKLPMAIGVILAFIACLMTTPIFTEPLARIDHVELMIFSALPGLFTFFLLIMGIRLLFKKARGNAPIPAQPSLPVTPASRARLIGIGLIVIAIGAAVTAVSVAVAGAGGTFVVTTGFFVWGGFLVLKGLFFPHR